MNERTAKWMGLVSAGALALGVQQAGAYSGFSDYDGSRDNGRTWVPVTNSISVDTHWTANNVYVMDRLITVRSGATLTIDAGTVIRGCPVQSVPQQPGSLFVCRGAKLIAQGTAQNPIIFTDMYDDNWGSNYGTPVTIPPGVHLAGALTVNYGALNNQLTGMWGGLLLMGRSYIAWDDANDNSGIWSPDGRVQTVCEAIVSGTEDTSYGGANDLDNSGTLNYVSVRYSGFVLGPSKEINGITFCGVGRNSSFDHLDVYDAKDDNVEFFGGCLNMKHLVTWNGCDDQIDTDTGWRGKVQFAMIVQGCCTNSDIAHGQLPDSSDKGLEWDGAGDSTGFNDDPQSCGTLFNATMIGLGSNCLDKANTVFTIRDNAGGRLYNNIFMDFGGGCSLIEGVTNVTPSTWPQAYSGKYGVSPSNYPNCSAAKLRQPYKQDWYYNGGRNQQGIALNNPPNTNYIGYPDAIEWVNPDGSDAGPSMLAEFKHNVFWNMGIPHSIGFIGNTTNHLAEGILYWGNDNGRFAQAACYGKVPYDSGYDIVAVGGNLTFDNASLPAPSYTPINYYQRETTVRNFKPTFRDVAHPYTCVAKIDPRANTNFWAAIATYGVQPPFDGFYTPVQFVGAMGQKNWAGPWSTPWRLGGFVTANVPTGDETGIVPGITAQTSPRQVTLSLSSDTYVGINADYWLVAMKSTGQLYYYNLTTGKWTSVASIAALKATVQMGLINTFAPLPSVPTTTTAGLASGSYSVYFGVDLNMNNSLSFDSLYAAGVGVTVP